MPCSQRPEENDILGASDRRTAFPLDRLCLPRQRHSETRRTQPTDGKCFVSEGSGSLCEWGSHICGRMLFRTNEGAHPWRYASLCGVCAHRRASSTAADCTPLDGSPAGSTREGTGGVRSVYRRDMCVSQPVPLARVCATSAERLPALRCE